MRRFLLLAFFVSIAGDAAAQKQPARFEDLVVVDCLLPGQIKSLGRRARFEAPRRATRTTALDCAIRGGEFTAYDRANYQTALQVWQRQADQGDAEAQYYVGQIYEQGLGTDPDYAKAAFWYEKAAAQNHRAAQISLGNLYEQGLGVPADPTTALKWYRKGSGASGDFIVIEAAEYKALLDAQSAQMKNEEEIERLKRELEELKKKQPAPAKQTKEQAAREKKLMEQLFKAERELEARRREIAALEQRRGPAPAPSTTRVTTPVPVPAPSHPAMDFGRFYALIIGNSAYRSLPAVPSAVDSARAMSDLLKNKYGFQVTLLIDADRDAIMNALNALRDSLRKTDNLVVFYAGHGRRDPAKQRGWWQPVDADAERMSTWLSNQDVSEHLNLVAARNVLVLVDSCYEGTLSRSSVPSFPRGTSTPDQIAALRARRSRLALTSGVEAPTGSGGVSTFTSALVQTLDAQRGVFDAWQVYRGVNDALTASPGNRPPSFAPIKYTSHEGGLFFFVRKKP